MFKLIEKAAEVSKQIESIARRAKKLDHDIHVVAVSCLHHANKHGDVTLMQKLIESLGKSQRRNAVIAWACAYGKFEVNETGKNVVYLKTNATDLEGASNESPWDYMPEPKFQPFDLGAELAKLVKKAQKASEDSRNKVTPEQLAALARLTGAQ